MEIRNLLEAKSRAEFRAWLMANHASEKECWVSVKRGRPVDDGTFWYIDAVEEALCFGWIDAVVKTFPDGVTAQRFCPRKPRSKWSQLNRARCRRMERFGLMTNAGRAVIPEDDFVIAPEIMAVLKSDPQMWKIFKFPVLYRRIRIDTIQINLRSRPELFHSRLQKFIDNTIAGIMYGEWNDNGRLLEQV